MEWDAAAYGLHWAEVYDDLYGDAFDIDAVVHRLDMLAPGHDLLELGVGTGRLALAFSAAGWQVTGVDASAEMLARLRAKPGSDRVVTVEADMADLPATTQGPFDAVLCAVNTFFALTSQEAQVRCLAGVAARLGPDGIVVVEAVVPDPTLFPGGQSVVATQVEADHVLLGASRHDPVAQIVTSQHVRISESGIRLLPVTIRYVWPSELDLMARLAGLHLQHRWADWHRGAFTATSQRHVSVYALD